jgi:putative heme transporter
MSDDLDRPPTASDPDSIPADHDETAEADPKATKRAQRRSEGGIRKVVNGVTQAPLMRATPEYALDEHRLVRAGVFSWATIGLVILLWVLLQVIDMFSLVLIPLVLALLPAALLSPASEWAKKKGTPPAVAAAIVLLGFLVGFVGILIALGWLIANELGDIFETLQEAYTDIASWIEGQFGIDVPEVGELLDAIEAWAAGLDIGGSAQQVATMTIEAVSGLLLALVALFFYLKDGDRLAQFALDLTPTRLRADMAEIGRRVWATVGGYFRGQILVAAVDAVLIGLGLLLLGVPLALPLAMLVFFGGLFPIVGAFTAGAVAVLIALADGGIGLALAVLVLNVVVQQAEGNLLEPLIVGRATKLHPLAVLAGLTAGAVTLGILGALLAVPFLACLVRIFGYLFERDSERAIDPAPAEP